MTPARCFGFAGSALARIALVALYAALAIAAIMLVEARPRPAATVLAVAPAATGAGEVAISIESTYPVATWTVRYANAPVAGTGHATRWSGRVTMDSAERQLVVEALPEDPLADGPCALRVALRRNGGAGVATTMWGSGFISGIVVLPGEDGP